MKNYKKVYINSMIASKEDIRKLLADFMRDKQKIRMMVGNDFKSELRIYTKY